MPSSHRVSLVLLASSLVFASAAYAQTSSPARPGPSRSLAPTNGAAASLPNTFDGPTAITAPSAQPPAAPTTTPGQVTDADIAEGVLRVVIADLKAGEIDETLFTPDMAARMATQLTTIRPLLEGYGEITAMEAQGVREGAAQYQVTFEDVVTQWVIGLNDNGLIAALLFRPAPPESSEPVPPAGS